MLRCQFCIFYASGNAIFTLCLMFPRNAKSRYTSRLYVCIARYLVRFLTRAGPGGGRCLDPPSCTCNHVFIFATHFHAFFRTCPKCILRSLKVRSPGHVKYPHLRKSLNACHSYTGWTIVLKLSAIDMNNSMYGMSRLKCWYWRHKIRSILRAFDYKSIGENLKSPPLDKRHSKHFET